MLHSVLLARTLIAVTALGATVPPSAAHLPHRPRGAAPQVVTIIARNYAFEAPDTVAAGRTELQLINHGTELHHAYLIRLDGARTLKDLLAAVGPDTKMPAWAHHAGGPNSSVPGGTSAAVVDLVAGNYAIICVIPAADGTPHVMKGMAHAFTVVPGAVATASAAAPLVTGAPDVTVTLSDYAFTFSKPLTRGHHVLRVQNSASQSHEMFVGRLALGKTPADALAWIEKQHGAPPLTPLGGTVGLAQGVSNDIPLDLTPGNYALFCFLPDSKDGNPHVMHGMIKEFSVR